jgi:hypothetical protein
MATNFYFSQKVQSEQLLYEDIVIESLQMYGQDVYYLPREIVNEDRVFGDDVPSRFGSAYKLEMYIENIEGFDGEGDLFTKFGVQIRDQASFVVARKRWKQTVKRYDNNITEPRPREGDLIYLPLSNSLFEIMHVEHEQPFYQLSNLPTFKLRCELFEYNDEDMDTGVTNIDDLEKDYAYTYSLLLDSAGTGSDFFTVGENVSMDIGDGVTMSGEVSEWLDLTRTLNLTHVGADDGKFHTFVSGQLITGKNGSIRVGSISEVNQISQDEQNDDFESISDGFLDFSESNPFGDPND